MGGDYVNLFESWLKETNPYVHYTQISHSWSGIGQHNTNNLKLLQFKCMTGTTSEKGTRTQSHPHHDTTSATAKSSAWHFSELPDSRVSWSWLCAPKQVHFNMKQWFGACRKTSSSSAEIRSVWIAQFIYPQFRPTKQPIAFQIH